MKKRIEEEHEKLKAAVIKRKTIMSGKKRCIDGRYVLTTSEILSGIITAKEKSKKTPLSK